MSIRFAVALSLLLAGEAWAAIATIPSTTNISTLAAPWRKDWHTFRSSKRAKRSKKSSAPFGIAFAQYSDKMPDERRQMCAARPQN